MKFKAVIFDLFETLITEWGHEKYTKRMLCADLGVTREELDVYWKEKSEDQYIGKISYEEIIAYVCEKLEVVIDEETMIRIIDKRIKTKATCFEHVLPEVYQLLQDLRAKGLKIGMVSNCSSEEVRVLRASKLCDYFDEILLSYEVGMKKPDPRIYEEAAKRLGVEPRECLFVGDGGSNELEGARNVGMTSIQAKWYSNRYPQKRENIGDFLVAEEPATVSDILGERRMELWDLYDSERRPLNRTHVRGDAFAEGEYYVCAETWVRNSKGEFLITQRHPNKKAGNLWEFTGGGTLAGESTRQSAIRELKEETGIQGAEAELQLFATYQHKNYFQDLFLLPKDVKLSEVVLQPEETVDAKWASEETILQMIENGEFVYSVGMRFKEYKDALRQNAK